MIDWDDAFDNTGYVLGAENLGDTLSADAAAFRAESERKNHLRHQITFGHHPREIIDLYRTDSSIQDVVIFVHGGYWHMLDNSYWSHLAEGALARGWAVAIPSYPLAPEFRIAQITQSIARAVHQVSEACTGSIRLVGHSAGGHLVSRMVCAGTLESPILQRIQRVVSVSGIHDLRPMVGIEMNNILRLTTEEAERESPALLEPCGVPTTFWVGAHERPEFLRQNRLIAESWQRKGAPIRTGYQDNHDHFSIIETLADQNSPLTSALFE